MEVFNRVLCKETIKLEPKYINKEFKNEIFSRLKSKVEGVCSKHGYIKHGSVEIYKIAPGVVELASLSGHVVFDVYFYGEVCNPLIGSMLKATISNINRFGILAEAGYYVGADYQTVLEIVIAKNSVNIQSEVDLDNVKIGDEVKIEVIGKKYELGEKKISAIGRVVRDIKQTEKAKKTPLIAEDLQDNEQEEVEEVYEEEEEESGEEEDENEEEAEEEEEDDDTKHGGSDFFSDEDSFFSEEEDVEDFEDGEDKESDASESDIE
jgi:DNA-directed RNA polymerase subunit E'/Rpb7